MSFPVEITLGNPDPLLKFTNLSDLFTVIRQNLEGAVNQEVATFVKSDTVPGVEDQGLLWYRLDTDGRLKGTYVFFNSVWVREEPPISARFGFFTGDPTEFFSGTGLGLKGSGPIAEDYWGWALMNGNNGTPNLSDRFLILGRMDNVGITGFSDNWRTNVNGTPEGTGGVASITLEAANTYSTDLVVGKHDADGEALDSGGDLYGKVGDGSADSTIVTGNTAPDAIPTVPPFYALAMIQFVGYTG